jgi:DnaK suppressor protein
MDQATQESFRPVIDRRLADIDVELEAAVDSTKPIAPDDSVGRLSRLDSIQMQQMALAGKRRLEEERGRLHEARRRIDGGNYGQCHRCGGDIALERLQHQPDAVMCMPCLSALMPKKTR